MRKFDEIDQQIRGLSASEFAELREWFLEYAAAGKLQNMVAEAKAKFDPGKASSGRSNMSTAKEELTRLIESQPADASREEIVRELTFHVMVERGLGDSDAKRVVSNDEMAHRIRTWRKETARSAGIEFNSRPSAPP
jgi:predicted transcriptional regulator